MDDHSRWQRIRSSNLAILGLVAGIVGAFLATLVWLWPRQPVGAPPSQVTPAVYHLRVQVLDPNGRPVGGSTVRASVGGEPKKLRNGWWKVEIPSATVPPGGGVTIRAEHRAWEAGRVDLTLGADEDPRAKVRLETPESRIGGVVVDAEGRAVAEARVRVRGRTGGRAVTDQDGKFELTVQVSRGRRVRLDVKHPDFPPASSHCYAGGDECAVTLESP